MLAETYAMRKDTLAAFATALKAFYAGRFGEAERLFQRIASEDPPAAAYLEKCRELQVSPPEGAWSGVWIMTSK
jgi:adenylate cyclase